MFDPNSPLVGETARPADLPKPPVRTRFAEDRLMHAVVWCDITPGAIISEADIGQRFGLTRAVGRAALARLAHEGWATPQPRAGWQILPVTGSLVGDILTARRLAEPAALAQTAIGPQQHQRLQALAGLVAPLARQSDPSARAMLAGFADDVDTILLEGLELFTARHLRKLWAHSLRVARFLGVGTDTMHESGLADLIAAVIAQDKAAIADSRHALIDQQEAAFLQALLKNDTALGPGSGSQSHDSNNAAAHNGRPT
jgi:DNA-binding GntR family transcriptional regulator